MVHGTSYMDSPSRHSIVVDTLRDLLYDHGAQLILHIRQQPARIKGLKRRIGFVERLLGVYIVREMHRNPDGQLALRSVTIRRDRALRDIVPHDLAFQLQIAPLAQYLQSGLTLKQRSDRF